VAPAEAEARATVRSPLEKVVRVRGMGKSEVARARRRGVKGDDGLSEGHAGVGDGAGRQRRVGWMEGCAYEKNGWGGECGRRGIG
jgi:hypothetical protein